MHDAEPSQRLDKWLWCARFFKTRSLAGRTIAESGIRVTRHETTMRTEKPGFGIRCGDTLTFAKADRVFVIEILSLAERRGPAPEAQSLYTDHSPPAPAREKVMPHPAAQEGRPSRKARAEKARFDDPF